MLDEIREYAKRIAKAKYFLVHLVKWDIKYKFRGTKIGILWTILQPLLLTLIIAAMFGFVFHQEMGEYAPYILSGLIVWDVINGAVVNNSNSFLQAETYIKQFSHPVVIYPLRVSLVSIITFFIAISAFLVWMLIIYPQYFIIGILSLPLTTTIYFIMSCALSTISSHIHIRFRDYPYVMSLVMQVLWYISPVFFKRDMFLNSKFLYYIFKYNPITQLLELLRKPFFEGYLATLTSYIYVFILDIVCVTIAWCVNKKCERNTIFYF